MAYKRVEAPDKLATGDALTGAMVGIGMNFAAKATKEPNIEDTLLAAAVAGMERGDLRVLSLLVSWLWVHHPWVNADRLVRAARTVPHARARCFWAAVGHWLSDRRFARLRGLHGRSRIEVLSTGTALQIQRKGEDARFAHGPLLVPKGVLRDRQSDISTPTELAKRHLTYRYRVLIGSSYRADMWAALEQEPTLSAATLARRTYGSFATAWQVKRDRELLAA